MQPIPRAIVDSFAAAFAGSLRYGMSAAEISDFFCAYSAAVRPIDHYPSATKPNRRDQFVDCVYALAPADQYCALNDLATRVRETRYPYPPLADRNRLRARLHGIGGS
jgi:hypothetical protein